MLRLPHSFPVEANDQFRAGGSDGVFREAGANCLINDTTSLRSYVLCIVQHVPLHPFLLNPVSQLTIIPSSSVPAYPTYVNCYRPPNTNSSATCIFSLHPTALLTIQSCVSVHSQVLPVSKYWADTSTSSLHACGSWAD